MERVKPYLLWIILGVALIALLVIWLVPIGGLESQAEGNRTMYTGTWNQLNQLAMKRDKLVGPKWKDQQQALIPDNEKAALDAHKYVIDDASETWPTLKQGDYIDFQKPLIGFTWTIVMSDFRTAYQDTVARVIASYDFWNLDPSKGPQGRHPIALPPSFKVNPVSNWTGAPGLPEILSVQRVLWFRTALARVITNPEVGIRTVIAVESHLMGDLGLPDPNRKGDRFVTLEWTMDVELPIDKVAVLLNALATSPRHIRVMTVALAGLRDKIDDQRALTDRGAIDMAKFREGRLVRATLEGVAFDFLIPPLPRLLVLADVPNWPAFLAKFEKDGRDGTRRSAVRRLWELVPDEVRQAVTAAVAADAEGNKALPADKAEAEAKAKAALDAVQVPLQQALNALLQRRDLFQATDPDVKVLIPTLTLEGAELMNRKRDELTQRDVERLNRLILEAAFGDLIGKDYKGWPT